MDTPTKKAPINLDDLREVAGSVIFNQKEVKVYALDGRGYQLIRNIGLGENAIDTMYKVAGLLLPDLTEDEVLQMNHKQIKRVVDLASEAINEVEASAPSDPTRATPRRARKSRLKVQR